MLAVQEWGTEGRHHLQEPGSAASRESKTLCGPSVICNYTDSYWPVGTILHKNRGERTEVYIRKDGVLKEKSFSAGCDRI